MSNPAKCPQVTLGATIGALGAICLVSNKVAVHIGKNHVLSYRCPAVAVAAAASTLALLSTSTLVSRSAHPDP
jgi:7-keto-8-aminopelargonate synthetase-like enzyme